MDNKRMLELAGVSMLTEAKEEKKAKGSTCPFCGTHVEHGGLITHIKEHHADLIEYYNKNHKDDKKNEKKED
jgi:hypothetical protein